MMTAVWARRSFAIPTFRSPLRHCPCQRRAHISTAYVITNRASLEITLPTGGRSSIGVRCLDTGASPAPLPIRRSAVEEMSSMGSAIQPAPGWPPPPAVFVPEAGWAPDPTWPAAPAGWQFWVDDGQAPSRGVTADVHGIASSAAPLLSPASDAPRELSWRERRADRQAHVEHDREVAAWQAHQNLADEVAAAASRAAIGSATLPGLLLKPGEAGLWSTVAALIEPRVQQGHYIGGYSGVSLHIAKGVNYRVGGTRGHCVPGPEVQTPVDRGLVIVTSHRVVFTGSRTTREWLFTRLIGTDSSSDDGTLLLHVSNRQKVSRPGRRCRWCSAPGVPRVRGRDQPRQPRRRR